MLARWIRDGVRITVGFRTDRRPLVSMWAGAGQILQARVDYFPDAEAALDWMRRAADRYTTKVASLEELKSEAKSLPGALPVAAGVPDVRKRPATKRPAANEIYKKPVMKRPAARSSGMGSRVALRGWRFGLGVPGWGFRAGGSHRKPNLLESRTSVFGFRAGGSRSTRLAPDSPPK